MSTVTVHGSVFFRSCQYPALTLHKSGFLGSQVAFISAAKHVCSKTKLSRLMKPATVMMHHAHISSQKVVCQLALAPAAASPYRTRFFNTVQVAAPAVHSTGHQQTTSAAVNHGAAAVPLAASHSTPSSTATPSTVPFSEDSINSVTLTGMVIKGPTMTVYSKQRKSMMVLGVLSRATGDRYADMARPVLVEAWNALADALRQQVHTGATIRLQGHLALDLRRDQCTSAHGPALLVKADNWSFVESGSLPEGRRLLQYQGEFDSVFLSHTAAATAVSTASAPAQETAPGMTQETATTHHATAVPLTPRPSPRFARSTLPALPRRAAVAAPPLQPRRRPSRVPHSAIRDLLLQGKQLHEIAAELGVTSATVLKHAIQDAEEEGASSTLWPLLLTRVQLRSHNQQRQQQQPGISASQLFDAMQGAIQAVGSVMYMAPIREYLLSHASDVSDALQQQEDKCGGPSVTYEQLKVLLAIKKLGAHPSKC